MNDARLKTVDAIRAKLGELQFDYDSQTLAIVLASHSMEMFRRLVSVGVEKPESVARLYDYLKAEALIPFERPVKLMHVDDGKPIVKQ